MNIEPDGDAAYKEQIEDAPMTLRELAMPLVLARVLRDRIIAAATELSAEALTSSDAGDRKVAKIGEQEIGGVTVAHGKRSAYVADVDAVLSWVTEHHPDEVEVIYTSQVRPVFLAAILRTVTRDGGWLNKQTGEIIPVDGVEISAGSPYLIVKPNDDAQKVVEEAWQSGRIDLRAALEMVSRDE